jgi:hypothetical protein
VEHVVVTEMTAGGINLFHADFKTSAEKSLSHEMLHEARSYLLLLLQLQQAQHLFVDFRI